MTETKSEVEQLREATREAHGVLKDLRRAVREAQAVRAAILEAAQVAIDERIDAAVAKGLEEYSGSLGRAIDTATQAVYDRFDTIRDILLGEDKTSRRQGKPSVPEMIEQRREPR